MTASLVTHAPARPTSSPAGTTTGGPQFRVDAIPTYKAHRLGDGAGRGGGGARRPGPPGAGHPRRPGGPRHPRLGADGYEADDVIGTLAARHKGTMAVDVVTGDRDLFQLVDDAARVRVIYTARGGVRDPDLVDEAFLRTKYAVASGQAYADMAVLRGDTSDGLPGVAGIGEKTAAKLIERVRHPRRPARRPSTPATPRSRAPSGPGWRRARPTSTWPPWWSGWRPTPRWPTSTCRCPRRSPTPR